MGLNSSIQLTEEMYSLIICSVMILSIFEILDNFSKIKIEAYSVETIFNIKNYEFHVTHSLESNSILSLSQNF